MAENNKMMAVISLAIILILGLVFANAVVNTSIRQTSLVQNSNESTDLSTNGCYTAGGQVNTSNSKCNITVSAWYSAGDWRLNNSQCYLKSVTLENNTGTAFTLNTDYHLFASLGTIQMLNTTNTQNSSAKLGNNLVGANYSYCDTGYLTNSGDRSLARLWVFMIIIALIIISAVVGKDMFEK